VREATWEQEDQLWKHYPNLFLDEYVYSWLSSVLSSFYIYLDEFMFSFGYETLDW
jgi:hypothetical protein